MLREFVQELFAAARRGDTATVTEVPTRPRKLLVSQGGERAWEDKDPPLIDATLHTLPSLIDYLAPWKDKAHVFVGAEGIVGVLDADDRRETASLSFTPTEAWLMLSAWTKWTAFRPETIIKALRGLDVPVGVLGALRKLDFKRAAGTVVETKHGRETLGKRVEAEVQGADELPEAFDVDVSVFAEDGCRRTVTVRVEVYLNVKEETIELRVTQDRLDIARAEVLADIFDTIDASEPVAGIRIFMGEP